jgi:heat shock protein HslJ
MSLRLLASGGLIVFAAAVLAACQSTPAPGAPDAATAAVSPPVDPAMSAEVKTMFIAPETKDCTGAGPMTCLQVAESADGPWTLFYDPIDGFTHEPGYLYELKVSVSQRPTPVPADASSLSYTLVEVVSKTAAGDSAVTPAAAADPLTGSWTLVSYGDLSAPVAVPEGVEVTATFAGGRVSGSGGCNRYGASYTLDGATLTIEAASSTMMACEEPMMRMETAYLAALGQVTGYRMQDGKLLLTYGSGQALTFKPASVSGLDGTSWQVTGYNNGRQAVVSLAAGTTISLLFADGKVSGTACNSYSGTYSESGRKVTISPLASTQMMCPEAGVMEQETAYLTALQAATTWQIEGSQLTLRDGAGAMQVTGQADVITR